MKNKYLLAICLLVMAFAVYTACGKKGSPLAPLIVANDCGKLGFYDADYGYEYYADYITSMRVTLDTKRVMTSMNVNWSSYNTVVVMIYANSGALLVRSEETEVFKGWNEIDIPDTVLEPGIYKLAAVGKYGGGIRMETSTVYSTDIHNNSWPNVPSTLPGAASNWNTAILLCANYCGEAVSSPTFTRTITITPTRTRTPLNTTSPTPVFSATLTRTNTPVFSPTITATVTLTATVAKAELISVPGGAFTQTDGSASFSHAITVFKIGKYEVTYELWYSVYQWAILPAQGYNFQNAGKEGSAGSIGQPPSAIKYQPVTSISWRDAIVWCNAYSEKMGLTPCYTYSSAVIKDARDTNTTACDNAVCVWTNTGYRLPTEGEWQYAASYINGSSWTPWNYASGATADYTDSTATSLVAWYNFNAGGGTHDTGIKNANALLIHDMSGNVFEWCWDWNGTYPGASSDYRGPGSGTNREVRGGCYSFTNADMRLGFRASYSTPGTASVIFGFRVAAKN